jgi:hypothetical protein
LLACSQLLPELAVFACCLSFSSLLLLITPAVVIMAVTTVTSISGLQSMQANNACHDLINRNHAFHRNCNLRFGDCDLRFAICVIALFDASAN